MKIIHLHAENIKRLKAVEITPDGNLVEVAGENEQGKSSLLDSIWYALGGKEALPSMPIRQGEERAQITITLGDGAKKLIVERTFTQKDAYLKVRTEDGATYSSPQKMLDDLIGALSFDPHEFAKAEPKKQTAMLRAVVKLDVDIDDLDRERKRLFDERTLVNREIVSLKAQAEAITVADDLPEEPIDLVAIVDSIEQIGKENADIEQRRANRAAVKATIEQIDERIAGHDQRILDLSRQLQETRDLISAENERKRDLQAKLDAAAPLPEPRNVDDLKEAYNQGQIVNAKIADRDRRREVEAQEAAKRAEKEALESAMEKIDEAKADAIANAKMPVEGLSFADGCVVYNGVPLDQASSAMQIKVGMAVAMAANPKLRVIRIADGALLSKTTFDVVAEMAKQKDFQLWVEDVDPRTETAVIIEDGQIKQEQSQ